MISDEEREALAVLVDAEVRPLLDLRPNRYNDEPSGYDCCGCSTYDEILDHCLALIWGQKYPPEPSAEAHR